MNRKYHQRTHFNIYSELVAFCQIYNNFEKLNYQQSAQNMWCERARALAVQIGNIKRKNRPHENKSGGLGVVKVIALDCARTHTHTTHAHTYTHTRPSARPRDNLCVCARARCGASTKPTTNHSLTSNPPPTSVWCYACACVCVRLDGCWWCLCVCTLAHAPRKPGKHLHTLANILHTRSFTNE